MKRELNKTTPKYFILMQKARYLFMVAVCMAFVAVSYAQTEAPSDNPNPPEQVPFDGGVSLLVAAGVAYGAKKGYDAKRKDATAGVEEEVGV